MVAYRPVRKDRRCKTHIGTASPEDETQHSPNGQPLWNGFNDDATSEAHQSLVGWTVVMDAVKLRLLKLGSGIDDLGRVHDDRAMIAARGMRVSQGLAFSSGGFATRHWERVGVGRGRAWRGEVVNHGPNRLVARV